MRRFQLRMGHPPSCVRSRRIDLLCREVRDGAVVVVELKNVKAGLGTLSQVRDTMW